MSMDNTSISRKQILAGSVVLVSVLLLLTCFRTVGAGEVGIISRFGEVNRTASSGIALKLPWPIERITKMDTRVQKEQQDAAAATNDLQNVRATLVLNYALDTETAIRVYKDIGPDFKDRIITPAIQESFKSSSAKYNASQLIEQRQEVKKNAFNIIKERLAKYNIRVIDLSIVNFSFSDEFTKAVENKQVSAQEAEQSKFLIEKNKNLAEAQIVKAQGEAKANQLVRESLTPELVEKYAIDKWDGKMPQAVGTNSILGINLQGN